MIKSTDDYEGWKTEVEKYYVEKFPAKKAYISKFMKYTAENLDRWERTYISYKLLWYLYEKKRNVAKNQHFWFGIIGRKGGEGKSTLGKHILSYLDVTFDNKRVAMNYSHFIDLVLKAKKIDCPAILIDEPEVKLHAMSKEGRLLRDILGKIRQLNLFVGVCANSLKDIPAFVYDRLSCVIFINERHRYWVWDMQKDRPKYTIIDEIKKEFNSKGHAVFKNTDIIRRAMFKNQTFSPTMPFDEKGYIAQKSEDLYKDIRSFKTVGENKTPKLRKEELIKEILKNNPNFTDGQIAQAAGSTREWANKVKRGLVKANKGEITNEMGDS